VRQTIRETIVGTNSDSSQMAAATRYCSCSASRVRS
jgi:hypothetical protein